ncbi:hypothetical protein [Sodalis sp.]|uniref:hypothetical protein n=1 Tax=Sodalis sp. (in: enterobacteria) TaxID=1898979 RepID=UPI003872E8B4
MRNCKGARLAVHGAAIPVEFTGELSYTRPVKWIMPENLIAATPPALAFGELTEVVAFLIEIDNPQSI